MRTNDKRKVFPTLLLFAALVLAIFAGCSSKPTEITLVDTTTPQHGGTLRI